MKTKLDACRILKYVACAIFVAGIVMQVFMLAEISGKAKERISVEQDISRLNAVKDNMELQMVGYERTTWIEQRAIEMGMQWPTDTQLRVIAVPREYDDATTHTAEITGSR